MTTLLALFLALAVSYQKPIAAKPKAPTQTPRLEFREFLAPSTTALKPSEKLLSLKGQRVRIAGFMAQMDDMPEGYFYLCSRPVYCDESGGGLGELPVDEVRVVIRTAKGQKLKPLAYPIEVNGILELGGQSEIEKESWAISLIADNWADASKPVATSYRNLRKKPKR